MVLLRWPLLLLAATVALPRMCAGSSSHSVKYFYTAVSEFSQGLPWFIIAGYLDDQRFFHYDSDTKRATPQAPWMEKVGREDYWEQETQSARGEESTLRSYLEIARNRYNQSTGLHTMQLMYGCELGEDGHKGGFRQYGYDGRDFIAFDTETRTWTAADGAAQITKRKWQMEDVIQRLRFYLEEECMEELQKHLSYASETLQRREPPVVNVTRKDSHDGLETLLCRAHGFYPREIDITWRRDGEVRLGDTFRGIVSPNADGTYYTWLSIEVDPQERSRFRCHVEHDGLEEPLDVAVEEPWPPWRVAVGVVSATQVVLTVVTGVVFYVKKRREGQPYKEAATSDQSSASSA